MLISGAERYEKNFVRVTKYPFRIFAFAALFLITFNYGKLNVTNYYSRKLFIPFLMLKGFAINCKKDKAITKIINQMFK